MVKVTNDLLTASDVGLISILVLLDLSGAFDTIDLILLQRVEHHIGIKGSALRRFKSYLSDRYILFQLMMKHQDMSRLVMESQGSVLRTLLFTLYKVSLGIIIRKQFIHFHCHVDDTQV